MPWSYPDNVPAVAQNWADAEQRRCVEAANAVLESTGDEQEAIFACIAAAGKEISKMQTKTFQAPIEIKADGDPGEFRAVFATFNVIDHDGDVTVPGAFTDGQKVRIAYWAHRWQDLPVGRGEIHADDEKAWVDGRFFLDTMAGKETYQTVKNLDELQEWSYGFDVLEAEPGTFDGKDVMILRKLDVHEVSPVLLGAGIGTQTVAIKRADKSANDDANEGEGQTQTGEPSGPPPRVVLAQIDIQLMED